MAKYTDSEKNPVVADRFQKDDLPWPNLVRSEVCKDGKTYYYIVSKTGAVPVQHGDWIQTAPEVAVIKNTAFVDKFVAVQEEKIPEKRIVKDDGKEKQESQRKPPGRASRRR